MKTKKTETNARRSMNTVIASLCTVLFAGAVILFAPGTGISQTTDPVGSPKTANVNLDKAVIVANSELAPVPVRDIQRKPITPVHNIEGIQTGEPKSSSVIYTVPAGKRLVIEFISAEVDLDGSSPGFRVTIAAKLGGFAAGFPLTFTSLNDSDRYGFTGMTKIYADAGTDVTINLLMSPPATAFNTLTVYFTGYLEDL